MRRRLELTNWCVWVLSVLGAPPGVDPECPGDEERPAEIPAPDAADCPVAVGAGLADAPDAAVAQIGPVGVARVRGDTYVEIDIG